jgi:hypothetical protein
VTERTIVTSADLTGNQRPNSGNAVAISPPVRGRPARKHISRAQRSLIREYLDFAFGHVCYANAFDCVKNKPLQFDHINGDRNDHRLANFRWACPRHQKVRTVAYLKVRERSEAAETQGLTLTADSVPFGSYESKKNATTEPVFRAWVIGRLVQNGGGGLSWDYLVEDGAEIYRVMQVTTDRYLRKLTAPSGPLAVRTTEIARRLVRVVSLRSEFYQQAGQFVVPGEAPSK